MMKQIRPIHPTVLSTAANGGWAVLCLLLFFASCRELSPLEEGNNVITLPIPTGFPYPAIPEDNQPTQSRIDLGEKLFFDPILSRDSSISCSSCHHVDKAFTDGLQFSDGIDGNKAARNSMTLVNAAWQPTLFWDGGAATLEEQVPKPIANPLEMDFDIDQVVERLKEDREYLLLFRMAYNEPPSVSTVSRAIACYERTLFSGQSRYDDYLYNHNTAALTESEIRGMDIFFGERGECFHCHGEYNFTDYSFKNNGLYLNYADSGRAKVTHRSSDLAKFKVPSLRNVALTAPYMHDGSIATLEDVVDHYDTGGEAHPNKSGLIQPLNLTSQEKEDIVNFLKALTDE
jgi:cytochrome c peroxidase